MAVEGASDPTASKFTSLVVEELRKRSDSVDVGPAVAAPPPSTPAPTPRAAAPSLVAPRAGPSQQTMVALDAGKRSFEELRFEDAVKELKQGIDGMLGDPATADFEVVLDATTKLAAAYFRMGEEKDAKAALNDLARLSPNHTLPAGFPPVFQRELEKAKKRLDKQPRGQVSIDGPAGATAFLDGRDLGMVPVLEENIPAGLHYVKVEGTKGEKWGQAVMVKGELVKAKASFGASAPAVVAAPERPAPIAPPAPAMSNPVEDAFKDKVASWAKATQADYALVGAVYRTSEVQVTAGTALYSVKKGAFTVLPAQTFDPDVLTATMEAYKVADAVVGKTSSFGDAASLPLNLVNKPRAVAAVVKPPEKQPEKQPEVKPVVVARVEKKPDDLDVAGPTTRKVTTTASQPREVTLTPKPEVRVIENAVDIDSQPREDYSRGPEVKKSGVPVWVWVATGVAVVGAGVGGYFGYTTLAKPVTGTVTATW